MLLALCHPIVSSLCVISLCHPSVIIVIRRLKTVFLSNILNPSLICIGAVKNLAHTYTITHARTHARTHTRTHTHACTHERYPFVSCLCRPFVSCLCVIPLCHPRLCVIPLCDPFVSSLYLCDPFVSSICALTLCHPFVSSLSVLSLCHPFGSCLCVISLCPGFVSFFVCHPTHDHTHHPNPQQTDTRCYKKKLNTCSLQLNRVFISLACGPV